MEYLYFAAALFSFFLRFLHPAFKRNARMQKGDCKKKIKCKVSDSVRRDPWQV